MLLAYSTLSSDLSAPAAAPYDVWLLHGILGSQRNWRSFARRLADAIPGVRVTIVDLRGHGDSAGFDAPHTLSACGADLTELAIAIGSPRIVSGHSFGAKVALTYAQSSPENLAEVWLLDAPPGPGASLPGEIERVIEAVAAIPMPVARRSDVLDALIADGLSTALGQWMTTNLRHASGGGLVWRFELPTIRALLASYFATDMWPALADPDIRPVRRVLRAARSDRLNALDIQRLRALEATGTCTFDTLPDAGHWLHADNPDGLLGWAVANIDRAIA